MAAATNLQVQTFVDEQLRPACENIRALKAQIDSILSQIGDVYAAVTEQSPTWTDSRTDGPPHLLAPGDVVNINAFLTAIQSAIAGNAQYPVVLQACVRPVTG